MCYHRGGGGGGGGIRRHTWCLVCAVFFTSQIELTENQDPTDRFLLCKKGSVSLIIYHRCWLKKL